MNTEPGDKQAHSATRLPLVAAIVAITAVVAWLGVGLVLPFLAGSSESERGIFGDQFGAVNALFSGLALGGIIIALWFQHTELKRVLSEQERVIRSQEDAAREHNKLVKAQITLNVLDDLRSREWGDAHAFIRKWHRDAGEGWQAAYRSERECADRSQVDIHRRTLVRPFKKLSVLWDLGIIDDATIASLISLNTAETLTTIALPMEEIRYDSPARPKDRFFEFLRTVVMQAICVQTSPIASHGDSVPPPRNPEGLM